MRRMGPFVLALAAVALAAAGCGSRKNTLVPNVPPETRLFVQGTLSTVNHVVHLYWFGSDPDGSVSGFEIRLHNPSAAAETAWVFTTRPDSQFTIYTPTGLTAPIFEVRAIDDHGLRDPTPAIQDFSFSNQPPTVRLQSPPGPQDTTFASVTLTWRPTDPDGDLAKVSYRVWLDGNEATPETTFATTYTIPTADFRQGGQLLTGYRRAYVQPIDDGGRIGDIDSTRWFVRAPVTGTRARLLIVDDVPKNLPFNTSTDALYANAVAAVLPPDTYTILRTESRQPFRSAKDVEQTLRLFESVIWYRGAQTNLPTLLQTYQDGVAGYLDAGGKFYVEGLNMIDGQNAAGAFRADFLGRYFGTNLLYKNEIPGAQGDSTVAWGVNNFAILRTVFHSTGVEDSLQLSGIFNGLRAFALKDTNDAFVWARTGALAQGNAVDMPVGITVAQNSGGRAMLMTVPLRSADRFTSASRVLTQVLRELGLP